MRFEKSKYPPKRVKKGSWSCSPEFFKFKYFLKNSECNTTYDQLNHAVSQSEVVLNSNLQNLCEKDKE